MARAFDMMTELEGAANWITGLSLSDVPVRVQELARLQRINIVASAYAGRRTRMGRALCAANDSAATHGSITLPSLPKPRDVLCAAYELATLAGVLEYDDFVFGGHTGQPAIASSLALGAHLGSSGEALLLAQIAANEIGGRLGAAMTAGSHHGHMKTYMHRACAATAAAKLLGLSAVQCTHALSIALAQPEYGLHAGAFSVDGKTLAYGDATVAGIRAALLAREGITGVRTLVEHDLGLIASLSEATVRTGVWQRLGQGWCLDAISFKPVAACAYACAAVVAVQRLEIAADQVESVDIDTNVLTTSMEAYSKPHAGELTPTNVNFSTPRSVALALTLGQLGGDAFAADSFESHRDAIMTLSKRIHLRHQWSETVAMLRGIDNGLDYPGRPGVYAMSESSDAMDRLNAAVGAPPFLSVQDVPALLSNPSDALYLARRYAVGFRAKLPFFPGTRQRYVARDKDLTQLAYNIGSAVSITTRGETRSERVRVVPGFAGDPDRAAIPPRKFLAECGALEGAERATKRLAAMQAPFPSVQEML
jgi:2-methylcitrate dehydratase PrpD